VFPTGVCSPDLCPFALQVPFEKEGLLFYHKEAVYTFGATPLVLYLARDRVAALLTALNADEAKMTLAPEEKAA